jgi:TonB family protein
MDKNLAIPLQVSVVLHLAVLFAITAKSRSVMHVPMSLDLMLVQVSQPAASTVKPEASKILPAAKPKEDFVIPKKKKNTPAPEKPKPSAVQQEGPETPAANQPVRAGSNILLETENFPFMYYLKAMQNKIAANWEWPVQTGVLKAVVYFKIMRDGKIEDVTLKQSSGDLLFDQASQRAVNLSEPMLPLPEGYAEPTLGVYFEFKFHE